MAFKGRELILAVTDGAGSYNTIAGIRTKSVRINGNPVDVTTDDDVNASSVSWRTYMQSIVDFEATGDGIAQSGSGMDTLRNAALGGTEEEYQITYPDGGTLVGDMFVASLEEGGQYDDTVTFSITIRAAGALTYTSPT